MGAKEHLGIFMAPRCIRRVDWCAQTLGQGIHMAVTTPALRKLQERAHGSDQGTSEVLGSCGTRQASKELRRKKAALAQWRSDGAEAGPSHAGFLRVPVQLQETQVVAFLGHNREDTTRG